MGIKLHHSRIGDFELLEKFFLFIQKHPLHLDLHYRMILQGNPFKIIVSHQIIEKKRGSIEREKRIKSRMLRRSLKKSNKIGEGSEDNKHKHIYRNKSDLF